MKRMWGLTGGAGNQIEGLFAAASDWALLHARRADIVALGQTMHPEAEFPMEEILPATLLCAFGSGQYINLCHMFWDRPVTDNVTLDDVLGIGERFPDHVCVLKWFERSPANLITAATAKGLVGDLAVRLRSVPEAERGQQRVLYRLIFEELARTLRPHEEFSSLVSTWRPADGEQQPSRRFEFDRTLDMSRHLMPLPFGPDAPVGENAAYLITEPTGDRLHLRFEVADAEQTVVALSSSVAAAGPHDETVCRASSTWPAASDPVTGSSASASCPTRVAGRRSSRSASCSPAAAATSQQAPTPIVDHDGAREFYYPSEATADGGDVWIGLPFFSRSDFRAPSTWCSGPHGATWSACMTLPPPVGGARPGRHAPGPAAAAIPPAAADQPG